MANSSRCSLSITSARANVELNSVASPFSMSMYGQVSSLQPATALAKPSWSKKNECSSAATIPASAMNMTACSMVARWRGKRESSAKLLTWRYYFSIVGSTGRTSWPKHDVDIAHPLDCHDDCTCSNCPRYIDVLVAISVCC